MKFRFVLLFVLLLICVGMIAGCCRSTPPNIDTVQQVFDRNRDDLQTVAHFLKNSGYNNVYITERNGTMIADLNVVLISEPKILLAIDRLLSTENFYNICKVDNTVYLLHWKGLQDIGCGIAYSIDKWTVPYIEYVTELSPLSDGRWFYYVSDYEFWRREQWDKGTVLLSPCPSIWTADKLWGR